jgi:hypothetical protein
VFVPRQSKLITKFRFTQLTGGVIIVKACIDNIKDSFNFILDTGSGGISLDSSTVESYYFKKIKSDRSIRGIAGIRPVDFTNNHSLKLPGLTVDSLDFHINDYDLLSSVYGFKIDGIVGYSFFRRYIVDINYDSLVISIHSPGAYKYPKAGYTLHPNVSALAYQQAMVKDEKEVFIRYIFDTGAGLCMLLSEEFVNDSSFIKKKRKRYTTQAEGLGGKTVMDYTVVKEIQLGPYKFRRVPIYIFKDEFNVTSYPFLGGLIGSDLLRRFNITINYAEQTIHLKPNSHFNDVFDYSYTGLGIYQVGNEVIVEDIIPGSPANKAGFKQGDIIFAIDRNFSHNIQTFKSLLQNAGNKVRVLVLRENQPVTLYLEIKNILR